MDRTEYTSGSGTEYLLSVHHGRLGISNARVLGARQEARTIRILVPVDISLSRMDLQISRSPICNATALNKIEDFNIIDCAFSASNVIYIY